LPQPQVKHTSTKYEVFVVTLHASEAAAQCIVIGPVCTLYVVCVFVYCILLLLYIIVYRGP